MTFSEIFPADAACQTVNMSPLFIAEICMSIFIKIWDVWLFNPICYHYLISTSDFVRSYIVKFGYLIWNFLYIYYLYLVSEVSLAWCVLIWYTRSEVIRNVTPHLAHVLDGTKFWPEGQPEVFPFLEDAAAATIAAGDGPNIGEAISDASPIAGGKLRFEKR